MLGNPAVVLTYKYVRPCLRASVLTHVRYYVRLCLPVRASVRPDVCPPRSIVCKRVGQRADVYGRFEQRACHLGVRRAAQVRKRCVSSPVPVFRCACLHPRGNPLSCVCCAISYTCALVYVAPLLVFCTGFPHRRHSGVG